MWGTREGAIQETASPKVYLIRLRRKGGSVLYYKNYEGFSDPTAGEALSNVKRDQIRKERKKKKKKERKDENGRKRDIL